MRFVDNFFLLRSTYSWCSLKFFVSSPLFLLLIRTFLFVLFCSRCLERFYLAFSHIQTQKYEMCFFGTNRCDTFFWNSFRVFIWMVKENNILSDFEYFFSFSVVMRSSVGFRCESKLCCPHTTCHETHKKNGTRSNTLALISIALCPRAREIVN